MALFSKDSSTPAPPRPQPRPGESQPAFQGTFFGPNVTVDGTVSGGEPRILEGTIKGASYLTNDLRVGTKARIEAKVHAPNVIVEGRLAGDISADDRGNLVTPSTSDGST